MSIPQLGIIEGFYGKPWGWQHRENTIAYLKPYGYDFYIYAPKADPYLRLKWHEDYPDAIATQLRAFVTDCKKNNVRAGIGISPVLRNGFDAKAKEALARKLNFFDDMTGANDQMAAMQIDAVHWAAERTKASRIIMCPSYYTDDPVLDKVFGNRPKNYVEDIGSGLDKGIEIFWTGEEVCSRQISTGHIERVTNQLQRNPFLWDNYPVNDGARMSQYLHVRGFTGRPAALNDRIAAHGVNPALQPTLSLIPCITLNTSYAQGDRYEYATAMKHAAIKVLGDELGRMLHEDALFLQDIGLDRLGEREQPIRDRYSNHDHEGAKEIIGWLDGDYRITDALIRAMAGNEQG